VLISIAMSEQSDQNYEVPQFYYSQPSYSYQIEHQEPEQFRIPWVNIILFVLTLLSTMFFGAYMAHYDVDIRKFWIFLKYHPAWWLDGLPFSLTLMVILLTHELGHYFFSRYHQVPASLPYFIPAPNLVGTFGAVIFMKGRIRDRKALLDIGAAGPLSGFIVSLFALYIGVKTAKLVPFSEDQAMILFNPNILFNLAFARWLPVTDANYIIQSPILDAAWVGMFVTMLNLFPIGQLDGGHIAYACLGRFSVYLSWAVLGLMMLTGAVSMLAGALFSVSLFWEGWFFFAAFALILMGPRGVKHPPPVFPEVRLDPVRWLIAIIALIVFLLTFIPMPFVVMGLIF